jgi:hypothetical protein
VTVAALGWFADDGFDGFDGFDEFGFDLGAALVALVSFGALVVGAGFESELGGASSSFRTSVFEKERTKDADARGAKVRPC